ncbi:MAG: Ribonuclease [Hyphomicrobiales bacterium]|nr:Ribonuclease [Hyphomicrobiales bacterium]
MHPASANSQTPANPDASPEPELGAPPESAPLDLAHEADRGRLARSPSHIPWKGWRDVFLRMWSGIFRDRVFSLAAGVAFYAILAIFPAIGATISVYGLFADATSAPAHLSLLAGILPPGAAELLGEQMVRVSSAASKSLGWALLTSLLISLWSANAGVAAIFDALNVVFKEHEKRPLYVFYALTLTFTAVAVLFLALAIGLIVVFPIVLKYFGWGSFGESLLSVLRWPALFVVVVMVLSVFYRYGPSRRRAKWRWVSFGSIMASMVWIAASILFSWYVASFDSYNRMYGSLGGIIAFMVWLWLSSVVVLLGAEIDAQAELQTAVDSTEGPPKPMGQRGAVVADTLGEAQP